MTYNFDPDRWYESHCALIRHQLDREEFDDETARERLADLERRYEELVARLDGTYEIPPATGSGKTRPE